MRIGSSVTLPIDVNEYDEEPVITTVPETEPESGFVSMPVITGRIPDVRLKYTTYPPNCDPAECVDSSTFPYMKFQVKYLNPIQAKFLAEVDKDANVVVCGSTSCGKTTIAEMVCAHTLVKLRETQPNAKVAYISPLKALASEKQADWTSPNHEFYRYNLSILTGDFILTAARKKELAQADIICMSTEMLGSRIRRNKAEKNTFLTDIKALIVDEAHLLTTEARGANLEVALMKFTAVNPNCRIIFLSATMPNVNDMGTWLTKLNGKASIIVSSDYRPVNLVWNWETFIATGSYYDVERNKIDVVLNLVNEFRTDKFIVFVHSKKTGSNIIARLKEAGIEARFHNADLKYETRSEIEASFKSRDPGSLRILVATSTLAWGLNMPARRVIITGLHRGYNLVDPLDITQMGGRAGRVGLDVAGDVHVLVRHNKKLEDITFCKTPQKIMSKINNMGALAFHLVAEIAAGTVKTLGHALLWYNRSLAHHQGIMEENTTSQELLQDVLSALLRCGAIKQNMEGQYITTTLGTIASWFYFSPFDVADWCANFKRIMSGAPITNETLAWALTYTASNKTDYPQKEMSPLSQRIINTCLSAGLPFGDTMVLRHTTAMYHILSGTDAESGEIAVLMSRYRADNERVVQAIQLLGSMGGYFTGLPGEYVQYELPTRVRYGMGDVGMELLLLPGIGPVGAKQIIARGIRTCKELVASHYMGNKILSDTKWAAVQAQATEIARIGHINYIKAQLNKRREN